MSNLFVCSKLLQIVTLRWTETRSLAITCSIEITCSIGKLHMPGGSTRMSVFLWLLCCLNETKHWLLHDFSEWMLGFSDLFTKIDGDEQGCLVYNSTMTRVRTLLAQFLVDGSTGLAGLGDKLLQVGIKSFIGFTKRVHGYPKWKFFVVRRWWSTREPLEPTTN